MNESDIKKISQRIILLKELAIKYIYINEYKIPSNSVLYKGYTKDNIYSFLKAKELFLLSLTCKYNLLKINYYIKSKTNNLPNNVLQ